MTVLQEPCEIRDRSSEVIPGCLYIGNIFEAKSEAVRRKHGITHVLTLCPNVNGSELGLPLSRHLVIEVDDDNEVDLLRYFELTYKFIEGALEENGKVFVHCAQGISRSPTVVAAYLIRKKALTANGALEFIRKVRRFVQPNLSFLRQLEIYECAYDPSPCDKAYSSHKSASSRHSFMSSLLGRDTLVAFSGKIYMREPFRDPKDAHHLLQSMQVTHVVGNKKPDCDCKAFFQSVAFTLKSMMDAASFTDQAIRDGGVVLIYDPDQTLAWCILCTYLVTSLKLDFIGARSVLDSAKEIRMPRAWA